MKPLITPEGRSFPGFEHLDDTLANQFQQKLQSFARLPSDRSQLIDRLGVAAKIAETAERIRGLYSHVLVLHEPLGNLTSRFVDEWEFPDGLVGYGYTVLSREQRDVALLKMFFALGGPGQSIPLAILDVVQGVKGEHIRLEDAAAVAVRSMRPLHETGWATYLSDSCTRNYLAIRDRYFEREATPDPYGEPGSMLSYYAINLRRKRVRALWQDPRPDGSNPTLP